MRAGRASWFPMRSATPRRIYRTLPEISVTLPRRKVGPPPACPEACYVVPVTIDTPRDLPIEVHLSTWILGKTGILNAFRHSFSATGIDLFWVTPDSPRDANGK